ncbi:hypothetical protein [Methylobacterium sp. E-046]|uniref:hypothetical protein n=1 Tax=Methylobacterium sp. E-046 TaxID=2836576 RepID=UPI001FBA27D4|nr:hypothetical protein [Methylobacterium sp. E-046]MCJ2098633.1 hypothetical protein [Methylobacterium sp. E-046]
MVAKSGPLAGVRRFRVSVCRFVEVAVLSLSARSWRLSTEWRGRATFSGMLRWAEILTTLILFAIVMSAIGWAASATAPSVGDWLSARIGESGIWAFLVLLWITGGVLLYREKAGKAAGK